MFIVPLAGLYITITTLLTELITVLLTNVVTGPVPGTALHQSLSKYLTAQDTRGTPALTKQIKTLARLGIKSTLHLTTVINKSP